MPGSPGPSSETEDNWNPRCVVQRTTTTVYKDSSPPNPNMAPVHHENDNVYVGRLLTITPAHKIKLNLDKPSDERFDVINLTNALPYGVAFKVKSTNPQKFRVQPSTGVVGSGSAVDVYVYLQSGTSTSTVASNYDKFLVMATDVFDDTMNTADLWKTVSPENIMEHKLRCSYVGGKTSSHSSSPSARSIRNSPRSKSSPAAFDTAHEPNGTKAMTKQLEKLTDAVAYQEKSFRLFIYMLLSSLLLIGALYIWNGHFAAQSDDDGCGASIFG